LRSIHGAETARKEAKTNAGRENADMPSHAMLGRNDKKYTAVTIIGIQRKNIPLVRKATPVTIPSVTDAFQLLVSTVRNSDQQIRVVRNAASGSVIIIREYVRSRTSVITHPAHSRPGIIPKRLEIIEKAKTHDNAIKKPFSTRIGQNFLPNKS
jgi:ribosomal protein S8E